MVTTLFFVLHKLERADGVGRWWLCNSVLLITETTLFGFCVYFEESPAGEGPYSIMPGGDPPILRLLMFP